MVVNGNLNTSYCEILGGSVRVKPVESSVPYTFGQVLGFVNTTIDARARARVVYLTRSTGLLPFGVEDLRPTVGDPRHRPRPGQQIPLALCGCQRRRRRAIPTGARRGRTPSPGCRRADRRSRLEVVDNIQQDDHWNNIGYVGCDQSIAGGPTTARLSRASRTSGPVAVTQIRISTTRPRRRPVVRRLAHLTNVRGRRCERSRTHGGKSATRVQQSLRSGPAVRHVVQRRVASASTEADRGPGRLLSRSGTARTHRRPRCPRSTTYARDDGDILQQCVQDRHYIDPSLPPTAPAGSSPSMLAFRCSSRAEMITLKLGGGGAQGNSGNYQGLDLDTNQRPAYQATPPASRIPPTRCSTAPARPTRSATR